MTDKGLSALSETSDSMTRELAKALVEQISFNGSLKDIWAAYRKKEVQIDCRVNGTKAIEMEEGDLPDGIEKITTQAEQIGDKILKVSYVEYVGRKKKTTRIEVKESELDEMLKQEDGPLTYQLNMF